MSDNQLGWAIDTGGHPGRANYPFPQAYHLEAAEVEILQSLLQRHFERSAHDGAGQQVTSDSLKRELRALCVTKGILLSSQAAGKVLEVANHHLQGYGILEPLVTDPSLEEVTATGLGHPIRVYHRTRGWLQTDASISTQAYALNLINRMARPLGRRVTYQNPRLNATLSNGSRLHASIEPLCPSGFELTIRRFTARPFSPAELIANRTLSARVAALLWVALESDVSLLIAGNTGSGKTSTLNALFAFVPGDERIIITEETPEIRIHHPHSVRLVANQELGIGLKDLTQDTLRMRPDRVIVGEARNREEVGALFDSMLAGQARGTYATFHACSSREALSRLMSLGVSRGDLPALGLILVQRRVSVPASGGKGRMEQRRVLELAEVTGEGTDRMIFRRDAASDTLREVGLGQSQVFTTIAESRGLSLKGLLRSTVRSRERWLVAHSRKNPPTGIDQFVTALGAAGGD